MKHIVFFDIETTGLRVTHDRIVELYMRKIDFSFNVVDEYHQYFNPEMPMPIEASNVHGLTDEFLADKPVFDAQSANDIINFISGCYLCGHNAMKFDVMLLHEELMRAGCSGSFSQSSLLDTLAVERKLTSHNLIDTYKRYHEGKDYQEVFGAAHGAKADTLATIEVFKAQGIKCMLAKQNKEFSIDEYKAMCTLNSADLGGYLGYNDDGDLVYLFGKNADKLVKNDKGYAMWLLGQDFPSETKQLVRLAVFSS